MKTDFAPDDALRILEGIGCPLALPQDEAAERLRWWLRLASRLYLLHERRDALPPAERLRKIEHAHVLLVGSARALGGLVEDFAFLDVRPGGRGIDPRALVDLAAQNLRMAQALAAGTPSAPRGRGQDHAREHALLALFASYEELTGRPPGLSGGRPRGPCFRFARGCFEAMEIPIHSDEALALAIRRARSRYEFVGDPGAFERLYSATMQFLP